MELLTPKDIASLLSMSPRSARAYLERNGVFPINVGLGSIPRLRWEKDTVISFLDTKQADTIKQHESMSRDPINPRDYRKSVVKVKKKYSESFFDLPVSDILDIVTSPIQ